MSAAHHIHPEQLKKLATEFKDTELGIDPMDPHSAADNCEFCSEHFLEWGKGRGLSGAVRYYQTPSGYHAVTRINTSAGQHIVDHTYNQFALFDDDGDVALSEPDTWREPMPMVKTLEEYETNHMRYPWTASENPKKFFAKPWWDRPDYEE